MKIEDWNIKLQLKQRNDIRPARGIFVLTHNQAAALMPRGSGLYTRLLRMPDLRMIQRKKERIIPTSNLKVFYCFVYNLCLTGKNAYYVVQHRYVVKQKRN